MGKWQSKADSLCLQWRKKGAGDVPPLPRFSQDRRSKTAQLHAEVQRCWRVLERFQPEAYNRGEWSDSDMWSEFYERRAELVVRELAPEIWKAWRADELRQAEAEKARKPKAAAVLPYKDD